ncbi:E7 [Castor canadensis papillomavirus 1]|uniref:Protein E7 n=1 Tax=Castor canadensis papillomavirus 1 TaxID=1352235 RepID=V9P8X8_9PAPI|nr:E7 [Castor canadensis papillomavirus 1]AGV05015.1 E7 [Castor canadensis papillomavirus 1]
MIGPHPTLKDIVLQEVPEVVDLNCYEQVPPEDILLEEVGRVSDLYQVVCHCARCDHLIRLTLIAEHAALQVLHQLLCGDISIVCPSCAARL